MPAGFFVLCKRLGWHDTISGRVYFQFCFMSSNFDMYIQYKCYIIDIIIGERAKEELCMTILDIFSWLPEKELSLEEIEYIVKDIENGITHDGYSVEHQLPEGVDENIVDGRNELDREGKMVCFLLKHGNLISMIGYR